MLGAGSVGVYITSPILRGDTIGLQFMEITHHDSIFGVMKDVSNVLWYAVLCLIQGTCEFMVESTTYMITAVLDIYILGVASGRHSKGFKMHCSYPSTR